MNRVVVAPHMDDESLGCGGLIAKHPADCTVVTMTDNGAVRAGERDAAMRFLGYTRAVDLGFTDGDLASEMPRAVAALDEVLAELRPDELYLPYPSLHQDHIAAYEAGLRSARISMSADHWFPPAVFVYDVAVYDLALYPNELLRWNTFEALTEEQVAAKQAACLAYVSEIPDGVHPTNSIRELCAAVGRPRRVEFAEQYALVRTVRG